MLCQKCGASLSENTFFCPRCGTQTTLFCLPSSTPANGPAQNGMPKKKGHTGFTIAYCILLAVAAVSILLIALKVFPVNENPHEISAAPSPSAYSSGLFLLPPAQAASALPAALPSVTPSRKLDELIAYFDEIALKSEYGDTSDNGIVRRWEKPLRVEIKGEYTNEDYIALLNHFESLNALNCLPEIKPVESDGNYIIHFVPLEDLQKVIPGYVKDNWGYITLYWDETYGISNAVMGIATDVTNQDQRNHLILEEFTQGLGLLNDSPKYPDSIFQIEWTEVQSLSEIDIELIKMLYGPAVRPGMPQAEAEYGLRRLLYNQ